MIKINFQIVQTIDSSQLRITTKDGSNLAIIPINPSFITDKLPPPPEGASAAPIEGGYWKVMHLQVNDQTTLKTYFISAKQLQMHIDENEIHRGAEVIQAIDDKNMDQLRSLLAAGRISDTTKETAMFKVFEKDFQPQTDALRLLFGDEMLTDPEVLQKIFCLAATRGKQEIINALERSNFPISMEIIDHIFGMQSTPLNIKQLLFPPTMDKHLQSVILRDAASKGFENVMAFLLANHTITQEELGYLCTDVAITGTPNIMKLILAERSITPDSLGVALLNATRNRRRDIVRLFVENQVMIPKEYLDEAIFNAVEINDQRILLFLVAIENRNIDAAGINAHAMDRDPLIKINIKFQIVQTVDSSQLRITTKDGSDLAIIPMNPSFITDKLPPPPQGASAAPIQGGYWKVMHLQVNDQTTLKTYFISAKQLQMHIDENEIHRGAKVVQAIDHKNINQLRSLLAAGRISDTTKETAIFKVFEKNFQPQADALRLLFGDEMLTDREVLQKFFFLAATRGKEEIINALERSNFPISMEIIDHIFGMQSTPLNIKKLLFPPTMPKHLESVILQDAASKGFENVMAFLLAYHPFTQEELGSFCTAVAVIGTPNIMKLFLAERSITPASLGLALVNATTNCRGEILRVFAENQVEIPQEYLDQALLEATEIDDGWMVPIIERIGRGNIYAVGINVHAIARDSSTRKAIELLVAATGTMTEEEIELANGMFLSYLLSQPESEIRTRAEKALIGPRGIEDEFGPLYPDDSFTIDGFIITGKEAIARFWHFTNTYIDRDPEADIERQREISRDGMILALNKSYNHFGNMVCNPGKVQRLVTGVLQGRLNGVNVDVPSSELTFNHVKNIFWSNQSHREIQTKKALTEAVNTFIDLNINMAEFREDLVSEVKEYARHQELAEE